MMIPLPKTIRGSKVVPKQTEYLLNLLHIDGFIVSRPASELVTAKIAEPRGAFEFHGSYYAIWGDTLYKDTALNVVGTIAGIGPVDVAIGFTQAVIVTGTAGANYTLDASTGALNAIVDPDVPACSSVTFIDGRFVYTPVDGSPLLWSEINDGGNVGSLSFFDAETLPDGNKATENIRNDLYVLGVESIERFRDVGPVSAPFVRVNNAAIEVGYVAAKIKTKDSLLFVGKEKGGGYAIYVFADGTAQPISPGPINERLNLYTVAQLAAITSHRFNWRGVECYVFDLPDCSLLFQSGKWHFIDSGLSGVAQLGRWRFYNAVLFQGTWYLQSAMGLYKLTAAKTDTDGKFSRQAVTFARSGEEQVFTLGRLQLGVANGVGAATVGLSLSTNGKIWKDPVYRSTGAVGEYDKQLVWQPIGGLGRFDGYAGICLYATGNVEFAADALVAQP